ncbi:MAG: hypothetical protein OEU92_31860 [Alphaproteobacteria bacterium]|nr:hypothetical protein [Alphaproteobacteria bacterium]
MSEMDHLRAARGIINGCLLGLAMWGIGACLGFVILFGAWKAFGEEVTADNHDMPDAPWCHEPAAEQSSDCRIYDGDLAAQPSTGPWLRCPSGAYFEGFHCIEVPEDYQPIGTIKLRGEALADVGLAMFDDQDVVAIIVPAAKPKDCDTWRCAGTFTPWTHDIWHGPGHDSDQYADRERAAADIPDNDRDRGGYIETPDDPNPWDDGNEPDQPSREAVRDRQSGERS